MDSRPDWADCIAAQLWCKPKHQNKVMDPDLACDIADALRESLASKTAEVEALKEKVRVMRKVVDCAIEVFAHDEDWAGTAIPNLGYAVSEYKALSTGAGGESNG